MGFMAKVKQWMGIGGVKVVLTVPAQVEKSKGQIEGKLTVSSKSDQTVKALHVELIESWTTGRGEEKETKELELGKVEIPAPFDIKAGETKEFPFVLAFTLVKSNADELKEKGGALGMLGKAAAFANAEKSTYDVKAGGDVKGTAFGPTDVKGIKLV